MKMNIIDRMVNFFSPAAGYRRAAYREAQAAYEAAKPGRLRRNSADNSSGDAVVGKAGAALRGYARLLEQNYDIAKGALDILVNNIVGPYGISVEPQVRDKNGNLHREFNKQLTALWNDWKLRPDVTWENDYTAYERLACRSWLRDGEVLEQFLEGKISTLDHGTRVPFSLELVEADHLPFGYDDATKSIRQGVERNAWGRPLAYHIYKTHPGDNAWIFNSQMKRVSADRMIHVKVVSRIRQARGVSVFASVIRRLEDLKDYEESERIAARVAAALTGFIKKGTAEDYDPPKTGETAREFKMDPGMIFDGLKPGEEVGTIDSNRPSGLLTPFHDAMTRFFSAGIGTTYSSTSRNYNGTYSAQRQELVEGWSNYQSLTHWWIGQHSRPVRNRFVNMCILSGLVQIPNDVDPLTLYDADFRGPAMPWINPQVEAASNKMLERAGYKSAQKTIRERGDNPDTVMEEIYTWRQMADEKGLVFESDPAKTSNAGTAQDYLRETAGIDTSTQ